MSRDFDVIVVGAGPAGSSASIVLARKGVSVLLIEKGKVPGEKNMSGGVLYGDFPGEWGIRTLIPDLESSAPLERRIISHEVLFLGDPDLEVGKARYLRLSKTSLPAKLGLYSTTFETGHDYSILRGPFDKWLSDLAFRAGAVISTAATVRGLLKEGGAVVGVRTNAEDIRAKVVIDASGVTSALPEDAGLRKRLAPRQLYHGIKRLYRLDLATIDQRFKVSNGAGRAVFYLGPFMRGISGTGFLYTNKDTISVGLVVSLDSLIRRTTEGSDSIGKLLEVLDRLEAHPLVSQLLDGAEPIEYSAHNIPKGFKSILKTPYADGFVAAGDALGAFVKIGPMLDGMRGAVASGMMAARAYLEATSSGSFKAKNLSRYRDMLSPIYDDVSRSGRDSFISESSFTYKTLPRLVFWSRFLSSTFRFELGAPGTQPRVPISSLRSALKLVSFDDKMGGSTIKVNSESASKSVTKPWIPTCPSDCFGLKTPDGTFTSFREIYQKYGGKTPDVISSSKLMFDPTSCLSCGVCGSIGPPEMVEFGQEENGSGVRYRFG